MGSRREWKPLGADVERKLGGIAAERAARLAAADPQSRDGIYTVHVDHLRAVVALLDAARRERDEARRMLGECYVLSGADTDGDGWEHNWPYAVQEVRTLREQYDEMVRAVTPSGTPDATSPAGATARRG